MSEVKFASMYCESSQNLGDEIQCIAASRLLPRIDTMVARERLSSVTEDVVVPMNAWFGPADLSWPPAPSVRPLYFGFHLTHRHSSPEKVLSTEGVEHLQNHGPIGCRDTQTEKLLRAKGIDTFTSWCATLTLPRRQSEPKNGRVFLVNADYVPVPAALRNGAVVVNQNVHLGLSPSTQRAMAEDLLVAYRDRARLVITTKIHCAMPCAAMGIPTVFIGDARNVTRLEPVSRILPVNQFRHSSNRLLRTINRSRANVAFMRSVDWDPSPIDYESEKDQARRNFEKSLERALE